MKATNNALASILRILQEEDDKLSIKDLVSKAQGIIKDRNLNMTVNYRKVYRAVRENRKRSQEQATEQ